MERIILSENKRYLMYESRKPFFWLGDTAWLLFQKLSPDEAEVHKDRQSKGFNVIQAVLIHQETNTNVYGESALYDGSITKTFVNGKPDLKNTNSYWNHVDKVIDMAEKRVYIWGYFLFGAVWLKTGINKDNVVEYGTWLAEHFKTGKI